MSQAEFAKEFGIPIKTIHHWEQGLRKPPEYVEELVYEVAESRGLIRKENEEMTTINIKDWLNKYPNKCAIIKINEDGETAQLVEQSASRKADGFLCHKESWYNDKAYSFISGSHGEEVLNEYIQKYDTDKKLEAIKGSTGFLVS